MKITFMGAGSTVFARNVIGDCMCVESLRDSVFALYDVDPTRLEESRVILDAMRKTMGNFGKIECYCGVEQRKVKNVSFEISDDLIKLLEKSFGTNNVAKKTRKNQ